MKEQHFHIEGVKLFQPPVFADDRGFFLETFRAAWLPGFGFVQDNHSRSVKGTLRGIHYQHAHPQGKLVRVVRGAVYDVAVDLRRSSPTFGQWLSCLLSGENGHVFWIPPGFGHGFLVLSDEADFVYKCTDYYAPDDQCSIRWDDPELAIDWPGEALPPQLSEQDRAAPLFAEAKHFA